MRASSPSTDPRQARWRRLTTLLDRLEAQGAEDLSPDDARELAGLYRAVSSDLLEEVRRDPGAATTEYLRALVGRGHGLLHRGTPPRIMPAIVRFFARDFPETFRRRIKAFLFAFVVFCAGAGFGAASLWTDPGTAEVLLPFGHRYMDPSERVEDEESAPRPTVTATAMEGSVFSAQLMTHNSTVVYFAFALAVTGGIGIVLLVFANGAYLGAVGVDYFRAGEGEFFLAWVGPHGVIEIPAILLGATAGFIVARALFAPGLVGRAAAMRVAGKDALTLLLGATATLVLAGVIEGTFSQIHEPTLPYPLKIAFAAVLGSLYFGYLLGFSPELVARLTKRVRGKHA